MHITYLFTDSSCVICFISFLFITFIFLKANIKCWIFSGYEKHYVLFDITGVGNVSVWEFSGYEKYYVLYDHFIGDINCIHLITISLSDSVDVQLTQLLFWIDFIRSRVTPQQQIGKLCLDY